MDLQKEIAAWVIFYCSCTSKIRSFEFAYFSSFLVNLSNRKGAIGFISRIFPFLIPIRLVKVDPDTNELLRDPKTGLCIQCQPGEPGELVSPIHRGNPIRDYDGYVAKKETNKKIISDVLKKGDICFR